MATSYSPPIPTPPPGKKIEAKGIVSALNLVFDDVPRRIILPALSIKTISNADNTQAAIYASAKLRAALAASRIEIYMEGVKISDFEELNPAGNTVAISTSFGSLNKKKSLDIVVAEIEVGGSSGASGATADFVFNEVPAGVVNGSNDVFSLSRAAAPRRSLHLYRNGLLQKRGATEDFIFISAATIKFNTGCAPRSGDLLLASYQAGAATAVGGDAEPPFQYRVRARKRWLFEDA